MKRLPRDQQKEIAEQARLMRVWKARHAEQLDEALAGTHGATIAELITLLDRLELNSAAALLDFVQRSDWSAVSYDIRLTVLHPVNQTISGLCKHSGLVPSDVGLPGDRNNVFRVVRRALLTPSPADAGSPDQGRVGRGVIAAHEITRR